VNPEFWITDSHERMEVGDQVTLVSARLFSSGIDAEHRSAC
jgi:hypothetical protein